LNYLEAIFAKGNRMKVSTPKIREIRVTNDDDSGYFCGPRLTWS